MIEIHSGITSRDRMASSARLPVSRAMPQLRNATCARSRDQSQSSNAPRKAVSRAAKATTVGRSINPARPPPASLRLDAVFRQLPGHHQRVAAAGNFTARLHSARRTAPGVKA
jgi:hypothetical protein